MSTPSKLTPAQFLAELRANTNGGSKKSSSIPELPSDELPSLDFSDLPDEEDVSEDESAADVAVEQTDASDESQHAENGESNGKAKTNGKKPAKKKVKKPIALKRNSHLSDLFDRVNVLLGDKQTDPERPFQPNVPETLEEAGMTADDVEKLVLKFLVSRGSASGRSICAQHKLPYNLVEPLLRKWKQEQLIAYTGSAEAGDYVYTATPGGIERGRRYSEECSYYGAAPVSLRDYLYAMSQQSIAKQEVTEGDLKRAFEDLLISETLLDKLGPAINSGRGMFLFGEPGNGKTSIAERVTKCFGSSIWIPRALSIDGDLIRLFDPGIHEPIEEVKTDTIFDLSGVDQRWVQIVRPTVIAGGELTMSELEVTQNTQTKICEAPLQLKSNCGTLIIDDFGRQRMPVDELLNRWIVPLEKRYDFLNLPSGKKVQVPFDQLIVFSTNLEPKDLVDGAFLRRIPYKIEAADPTRDQFAKLFEIMAPKFGFEYDSKAKEAVEYLITTHYEAAQRPFRACQPRDLLLQIKNFCVYKSVPKKITPEGFDFSVENYFSVM